MRRREVQAYAVRYKFEHTTLSNMTAERLMRHASCMIATPDRNENMRDGILDVAHQLCELRAKCENFTTAPLTDLRTTTWTDANHATVPL